MNSSRVLRAILALVIVFAVASTLGAETRLIDVNSALYEDLDDWQRMGLLPRLPALRPYPRDLIIQALERVVSKGDAWDRARAEAYLAPYRAEGVREAGSFAHARIGEELSARGGITGAGVFSVLEADALVEIAASALDSRYESNVLAGTGGSIDILDDNAQVSVRGTTIYLRPTLRSLVSVGPWSLDGGGAYLMTGISRASYGPIVGENPILSGQARHMPLFAGVYEGRYVSATVASFELTASDYLGSADRGNRFGGKRLIMHGLRFSPTPAIDFAIVESIVMGPAFDLRYYVPLSVYFYSQAFSSFGENSVWNGTARVRVRPGLTLDGVVFMDDFDFNDFVTLEWTKLQAKIAAQAAVTWNPTVSWLRRVRVDYLAITPYTYTHHDQRREWLFDLEAGLLTMDEYERLLDDTGNFQSYTHYRTNLGPSMLPNSDRLRLDVAFSPTPRFDVDASVQLLRHGNASENYTTGPISDGGLYDDGYDEMGTPTFADELRFLTQDVLERRLAAGVAFAYELPLGFWRLSAAATYHHEFVWNEGLVAGQTSNRPYATASLGARRVWY